MRGGNGSGSDDARLAFGVLAFWGLMQGWHGMAWWSGAWGRGINKFVELKFWYWYVS